MDKAERVTEVLKELDSRGAGCYHARRDGKESGARPYPELIWEITD